MRYLGPILATSMLVFSFSDSTAQASASVSTIDKTAKLIVDNYEKKSTDTTKIYLKGYTKMVLKTTRDIASQEGILKSAKMDTKPFERFVARRIKKRITSAATQDSARERKAQLYKELRTTSTQSYAESVISAWLNLPKAPKAKKVPGPRASTQTRTQSSGDLQLYQDPQARFVDYGGPGTGNGVVDAGEWIKVKLKIKNKSLKPFVSTSAWVTVNDSCAWTFPDEKIILPELNPQLPPPPEPTEEDKPPKEEYGESEVWVYISNSCPNGREIPLVYKVYDTHQAPRSPITLTARIRVTNRGASRVLDYLVDADNIGYSEGGDATKVAPEQRLEFSHNLNAGVGELAYYVEYNNGTPKGKGPIMKWSMAPLSKGMFKEENYAGGEFRMNPKGGKLTFADDFDVEAKSESELHKAIDAMSREWKWKTKSDAKLWLLTDTEIKYKSFDPPKLVVEELSEVCGNHLDDDKDGKIDCDDPDCEDEDACKEPPQALDVKDVQKLIRQHARIVASPTKPKVGGAFSAVDPNYELVFDEGAFSSRYKCAVNGLSAKQCGPEDTIDFCSDKLDNDMDGKFDCDDSNCKKVCAILEKANPKEKEEVQNTDIDSQRSPVLAYNYRHFFVLPTIIPPEGTVETCFDELDNDLDGQQDCDDSDCSELCQQAENDYDVYGKSSCRNGSDDDRDRKVDCDDPDCSEDPYCNDESDYSFHGKNSCQDGIDNDQRGDGIDCNDRDGCRQSPECARPTQFSIDIGGGLRGVSVVSSNDVLWSSPPTLLSALIRPSFSFGGRGKSFAPSTIFALIDSVPGTTALINESTDGSVTSLSIGIGFAYRIPLTKWLMLEPHFALGQQSLALEMSSEAISLQESSGFFMPGLTIRTGPYAVGPLKLSGFLDTAYQPSLSLTDTSEMVDLLTSKVLVNRFGLGIHF